jgi:DNA-binding FadR family transcriptional regulator
LRPSVWKDIIFDIFQGAGEMAAKTTRSSPATRPERKPFGRNVIAFRSPTLSTQIVGQVRDALFAKELRPGDFLGTEKDLAERFGVSRIVARDALRTLEAQGIVEIKVGSGGGARIAKGNARLFAEALAVQLDLAGVTAGEIMEAQRAIECHAAELAAINATAEDHARLRDLLADAESKIGDVPAFPIEPRIPSRGGGSLAQPRAGGAADLAAARVVAVAEPDADAARRPPRARRAQGARGADRNARPGWCPPPDGRPREDDHRATRRRASRQTPRCRIWLLLNP